MNPYKGGNMDKLKQIQLLIYALENLKVDAEAQGGSGEDCSSRDWNTGLAVGYGHVIRQLEKILHSDSEWFM